MCEEVKRTPRLKKKTSRKTRLRPKLRLSSPRRRTRLARWISSDRVVWLCGTIPIARASRRRSRGARFATPISKTFPENVARGDAHYTLVTKRIDVVGSTLESHKRGLCLRLKPRGALPWKRPCRNTRWWISPRRRYAPSRRFPKRRALVFRKTLRTRVRALYTSFGTARSRTWTRAAAARSSRGSWSSLRPAGQTRDRDPPGIPAPPATTKTEVSTTTRRVTSAHATHHVTVTRGRLRRRLRRRRYCCARWRRWRRPAAWTANCSTPRDRRFF